MSLQLIPAAQEVINVRYVKCNVMYPLCGLFLVTPLARRAWRSYKFAWLRFSVLFSVSQVGLPLIGVTAVHS